MANLSDTLIWFNNRKGYRNKRVANIKRDYEGIILFPDGSDTLSHSILRKKLLLTISDME